MITNIVLNGHYNIIPDYINLSMASNENCSTCKYIREFPDGLVCSKFIFKTNKESICNFYE